MKKAAIIFAILFIMTLIIPMVSILQAKNDKKTSEVVTIFQSSIHAPNYHSPFLFDNEQ